MLPQRPSGTETTRLIRDGEKGAARFFRQLEGGGVDVEEEGDYHATLSPPE